MTLRPSSHELTQQAICRCYRRAIDAYTVKDALRWHSALVDLLLIQAKIVRISRRSEPVKTKMIGEITARAQEHRDAVDRLTDIIEGQQQAVWTPPTRR